MIFPLFLGKPCCHTADNDLDEEDMMSTKNPSKYDTHIQIHTSRMNIWNYKTPVNNFSTPIYSIDELMRFLIFFTS